MGKRSRVVLFLGRDGHLENPQLVHGVAQCAGEKLFVFLVSYLPYFDAVLLEELSDQSDELAEPPVLLCEV
jgi:hypothetical protein